jgi:EF hand
MRRLEPFVRLVLAALICSCASPRRAAPAAPVPAAAPAARAAELSPFERLAALHDRNGDGLVSRDEYGRTDEAFRNLDRDRNGIIDRRDFEKPVAMPADLAAPFLLVRRFAGPEADSVAIGDLDDLFAENDADKDGALDRAELAGPESRPGPDRIGPLLAAADADKDGRLTLAELKTWALARDKDDDGRISVRERMTPGHEPKTGWFEPAAREPAPDFTLPLEEGRGTVTLSSFRDRKPVALIFGSFT